jgi:single-strand DNA-binding protein
MASFNRVILVGNLTRDVELKYLQSGTAVTEVGLAVNSRRKNQAGEWVEETVFVDVTLWGRTAEVASEFLGKGSSVLIEGRLKLDSWEKDGQKHSRLRVVGELMQMLGAPRGSSNAGRASRPPEHFDESEHSRSAEATRGRGVEEGSMETVKVAESPAATAGPGGEDIPF